MTIDAMGCQRAGFRGRAGGDSVVIAPGIAAAGPPLRDVEHHRVSGPLELIAQWRPPGGDPQRRAGPSDLQREAVDIEILMIEGVFHSDSWSHTSASLIEPRSSDGRGPRLGD